MPFCPGKTDGILVAGYATIQSEVNDLYKAQLAKQGTTDVNEMDIAAFVPCPKDFDAAL